MWYLRAVANVADLHFRMVFQPASTSSKGITSDTVHKQFNGKLKQNTRSSG